MSDEKGQEEKTGRPNAGYELSKKNQDENNLDFYYSREARLAKAPQAVRDLYNPAKPKTGFLRSLIGDKSRALVFGSILLICAALMLISILNPDGAYKLDGNRVSVQAMKYDGAIIVLVKKTVEKNLLNKAGAAGTGIVDIGVSPVPAPDEDTETGQLFMHRIFFTAADSEEFRFSIPFESDKLIMVLQTEKSELGITVNTD